MAGNRVGSDQEAGAADGERMKVVAIIQVRASSTRLQNKAFLPLAGKSMTQNLVERVKRASRLDDIVLAFPDTRSDADTTFADLAVRCGVGYYHGTGIEENDLVGRHLRAAELYHADIVVRIPGDNPCLEPNYIDKAVDDYLAMPYTFYSNTTDQVGDVAVDGIGGEVFSLSRLKWLDRITADSALHREHPHLYFYESSSLCGIRIWQGGAAVRLDVNTREDYEFIADIYQHFGHNRFTVEEVLGYLDSKKVPVG